jgi:hypothetical protein
VAWGGFGGTNVRPLIIALVVSIRNHRDGRVATFRPIPQSVSGVGVRFSIGDKIRNLGEQSFCLTRRESKVFIQLRCCSHFSFFILTELGHQENKIAWPRSPSAVCVGSEATRKAAGEARGRRNATRTARGRRNATRTAWPQTSTQGGRKQHTAGR